MTAFQKQKQKERVIAAVKVVKQYLRSSSTAPADALDLLELLGLYREADTDEDLQAADAAILEILEDAPVEVRQMRPPFS